MTPSHSQHRVNAMSLLLARYITGEIAEAQFADVTDLLDETDASANERAAFARFYLDALTLDGDVKMPRTEEVSEILNIARA